MSAGSQFLQYNEFTLKGKLLKMWKIKLLMLYRIRVYGAIMKTYKTAYCMIKSVLYNLLRSGHLCTSLMYQNHISSTENYQKYPKASWATQ